LFTERKGKLASLKGKGMGSGDSDDGREGGIAKKKP